MKILEEVSARNRSVVGFQASQRPLRPTRMTADLKTSDEAVEEWLATFKAVSCPGLTLSTPEPLIATTTAKPIAAVVAPSSVAAPPDPLTSDVVARPDAVAATPGAAMSINASPCCGSCGYINCPTKLLAQHPT